MKRILLVTFDQLNRNHGVLKDADPQTDVIVLVESQRMIQNRAWHKQRLFFLISSARHFAAELSDEGFTVKYIKSPTTIDGLNVIAADFPNCQIFCATPHSYRLRDELSEAGVQFIENDFFLTSEKLFTIWAERQKTFTMENFYRAQRVRLNILMDGDSPTGGRWNFDADNRLPPPKNHDWGPEVAFELDGVDRDVLREIPESSWGDVSEKYWATTRDEALNQLHHFLENHFQYFGPYEDAMPSDSWRGHHSLLSPYLNNGLLHPRDVVDAALKRFEIGDIPLSSCEGFIRQIIGWREYINGMYWYLGSSYRELNQLQADRHLLPLYTDPKQTQMNCVRSVVQDVYQYGWTHHIPRLMVLSNLALLSGVSPQEYLNWMREVFVDAADWVMVPNVIGMATHADASTLMTKPYAAGGAYISKMGQFCQSCIYDPKKRTGDDACPFTTLYWDFLDRNKGHFASNHRMIQQMSGLKKLSNLPEVKQRAQQVLVQLENGDC